MQTQVASLTIFERSGGWTVGVQPTERALDLLPTCSVALITSTALITDLRLPLGSGDIYRSGSQSVSAIALDASQELHAAANTQNTTGVEQ